MTEINFDTLNFDEISISLEDIQKRVQEIESKGESDSRGKPLYYPGLGISEVRLLPYFDPADNKWKFDAEVHTHDGFLDENTRSPCVRAMFGENCEICGLGYRIGKKFGFKDARTKHYRQQFGLGYPKFRHYSNIYVIKDCGHEGSGGFKRGPYEAGKTFVMQLSQDPYKMLLAKMADPDWGPVYHPKNGRVMKINVTVDPKTKYNTYLLDFKPTTSPLHESETEIRRILSEAENLSPRRARPSPEMLAAIKMKVKEIEAFVESGAAAKIDGGSANMEKAGTDITPPKQESNNPVPPHESKMSVPGETLKSTQKQEIKTESQISGNGSLKLVPTSNTDPSTGKRVCYKKAVYDASNPECQLCELEFDCSQVK